MISTLRLTILALFAVVTFSYPLTAQDTVRIGDRFAVVPFFGMDRLTPNNDKTVRLPEPIETIRRLPSVSSYDGTYGNYPQWHFSMFAGLATETKLADGYHFRFNLIGEDRAGSYGVLKQDNVVIFPQISASISDTLSLEGEQLIFGLEIGDMVEFTHRQGLSIYNVDVQGAVASAAFRKLKYSFTSVTDLSQHVGLRVGEVYGHDLALTDLSISSSYEMSLGIAVDIIPGALYIASQSVPHAFIEFKHRKRPIAFFGEWGYRYYTDNQFFGIPVDPPALQEKLAGLIGVSVEGKVTKLLKHRQKFLVRYYGNVYNRDRRGAGVKYRSGTSFVGRYLYPLRNAYRPFDQWAVYTEYGNANVGALVWDSRNKLTLHKKLLLMANMETVAIMAENQNPFVYYLYEVGLVFEPTTGVEALVYLTNKVMNLDVHYQTFYQSNNPLFSFGLRKRLTGYL